MRIQKALYALANFPARTAKMLFLRLSSPETYRASLILKETAAILDRACAGPTLKKSEARVYTVVQEARGGHTKLSRGSAVMLAEDVFVEAKNLLEHAWRPGAARPVFQSEAARHLGEAARLISILERQLTSVFSAGSLRHGVGFERQAGNMRRSWVNARLRDLIRDTAEAKANVSEMGRLLAAAEIMAAAVAGSRIRKNDSPGPGRQPAEDRRRNRRQI